MEYLSDELEVSRALDRQSGPVQNMGVDHGGGDIRMPQKLLHRADVVACFEQVGGKGVAQGMATYLLGDTGPQSRAFHGLHGVFGLPHLPLLDFWTIAKIFQKRLDILARTIPQFFSREEINKSLRPFDIKGRTIRPYPVLLQASLKGVPKSLSCRRLVLNFFLPRQITGALW